MQTIERGRCRPRGFGRSYGRQFKSQEARRWHAKEQVNRVSRSSADQIPVTLSQSSNPQLHLRTPALNSAFDISSRSHWIAFQQCYYSNKECQQAYAPPPSSIIFALNLATIYNLHLSQSTNSARLASPRQLLRHTLHSLQLRRAKTIDLIVHSGSCYPK